MKVFLQKKSTKISIAIIILAVAIGIIGINVRSAQRQREYNLHIEAAEKYLTELDYEGNRGVYACLEDRAKHGESVGYFGADLSGLRTEPC